MDTQKHPSFEEPVGEKPALSKLAPFLTYIADLVFASLVFIVFFLATWHLHRWVDALRMTNFLVYVRLIELAVISFGTLLCVLFFLRTSVQFARKLIRQPQKPTNKSEGKPPRLHPRDIARRFGEPLHRQNIGFFVCSVFIIVAFLYVAISFAELVRDDCDDTSILAGEMLCETGPDFTKPVSDGSILDMLASYSKYLEHEYLPDILSVLTENPAKGLAAASQTVCDIDIEASQEKIANDIWRAGEEVMLGRLKAPKFLPRGISLHEYREVPEQLLIDIKKALEESKKARKLFDDEPSLENAVHSCERNRKTILLMFLARNGGQNQLLDEFAVIVEACRKSNIEVAGRIQEDDDPRKEFLEEIIAQSENRRLHILEAIKKRDIQEAIEHMWDAIEISYSRRDNLLRLCNRIRSAGNYSDNIGS